MVNFSPTVFIVEPDASVRTALAVLLRRAGLQTEPCVSARDFVTQTHRHGPGCLMLYVAASDLDGPKEVQQIVANRKEIPIIAMSSHESIPLIVRTMKAGAIDFLLKPLSNDVVLAAVEQALGRSRVILQQESELLDLRSRHDLLSPREQQVMARIVAGSLNKQVGAALGISEITVKAHRGRVMRKMGADSLADLVRMALRLHLPLPSATSTQARASDRPVDFSNRRPQPIRIMPTGRSRIDTEPVARC